MKFKIVQQSQVNWQVQSPTGIILQKDITISSSHDAEVFIRGYVSSFHNGSYEVVPLPKKEKKV